MNTQAKLPFAEPTALGPVSRSTLILALLRLQGTCDRALPERFTSADVALHLGLEANDGAVSGFLSKAVVSGMLRDTGLRRAHGRFVYEIADVALEPTVRETPGVGSMPGKTHRGGPRRPGVREDDGTLPLAPRGVFAPARPRARRPATLPKACPPAETSQVAVAPVPAPADLRMLALAGELQALALRCAVADVLSSAPTELLLAELGRRAGCECRTVAA